MDLIIIIGPPASGKMTVGRELQKQTGYRFFHNHMSLELVNQFFDFGTTNFESLDKKIRFDIFSEVAKSEIKGLIFTMVWAFNQPEDEIYIDDIIDVFKHRSPKVCFVELKCDLKVRLERNKQEDRLLHKPSKRDTALSERVLLHDEKKYRMNRFENELSKKNFYKIDNTEVLPEIAAKRIIDHFQLNVI